MPGKRDLLKRGVMCGLALLVVCGSATVRSQEGPRITFEHDGKGVSGFVLYAQPEKGKEMRIDLGLPPKGTRGGALRNTASAAKREILAFDCGL